MQPIDSVQYGTAIGRCEKFPPKILELIRFYLTYLAKNEWLL